MSGYLQPVYGLIPVVHSSDRRLRCYVGSRILAQEEKKQLLKRDL